MAKPWKELGRYGGVGIEIVVAILLLSSLGHWLDDRYWGKGSWGLGVGFLLGVAVGIRTLVRVAGQMQRDVARAEANDPSAGRWTVDENWLHPDPPPDAAGDGASGSGAASKRGDDEPRS